MGALRSRYEEGKIIFFDEGGNDVLEINSDGSVDIKQGDKLKLAGVAVVPDAAEFNLLIKGIAAGYKVARGLHTQVAASDTVVTGLTTVVAVVVSWESAPTIKQLFVQGSIGDQAGSPAAGSILIKTYKPTAVNDVTPTAATDFSENLKNAWVAIGT